MRKPRIKLHPKLVQEIQIDKKSEIISRAVSRFICMTALHDLRGVDKRFADSNQDKTLNPPADGTILI